MILFTVLLNIFVKSSSHTAIFKNIAAWSFILPQRIYFTLFKRNIFLISYPVLEHINLKF